jgi:hypothetical protein
MTDIIPVKAEPKAKKSEGSVMTYNGGRLTEEEWDNVVTNMSCSHCDYPIHPAWPKYTSVQLEKRKPRIICPSCVVAKFKSLAPKMQENIVNANGYSPVDFELERAVGTDVCH